MFVLLQLLRLHLHCDFHRCSSWNTWRKVQYASSVPTGTFVARFAKCSNWNTSNLPEFITYVC